MASVARPLLLGALGGGGGVLLAKLLTKEQGVDITFQEQLGQTPDPLIQGRAGEILKYGAPKEGVSQPLVYR